MKLRRMVMKIFKLICLFVLLLGKLNAGLAQQDPPANGLTLSWLTEEIVRHNEALSAMELRLNAKRALIESADALDDPRISYSIAPSSLGDDIPSDFGNALRVRSVIQVSQAFPWPGKLDLRSELSETDAAIAEYSYEELLLSLVNRGRSLWAELWYVEKALATNENHKALLSDLEAVVATQYASGIGLQQDLLQIQSDLVDRELQETMLVQERRRIKAAINLLLNNNTDTELASPASEISEPDLPEQTQLQTWISDSNPMLLRVQLQSHQALTEQRLIEKEDFPDWQLIMGYW
jgi:cobalt-zinc-cadmium efflux system outer membrane protein